MDNFENKEQESGAIKISTRIFNIKLRLQPHAWHPSTDLIEAADAYIIKVEIAGMTEDAFTVNIKDNTVFISGQRPLDNPEGAYHQLEIPYGDFNTMVELPQDIAQDKIEAYYQNGFLTVTLPKAKPVNIEIK